MCVYDTLKYATEKVRKGEIKKPNLVWIECTGCSGDIISFLNSCQPNVGYFLNNMVNLTYSNSLMQPQGEAAYEVFLETLNTEFIMAVEGSLSVKENGAYTINAEFQGRSISAAEMVAMAANKAKHIIALGTCAAYGGISAGRPNPSEAMSLSKFLGRKVINVPGCPVNPLWAIGTIGALLLYGEVELDEDGRPTMFFSETNHNNCERRSYFQRNQFAKALGDKECMLKLGCRGPVTKAYCPIGRWNCGVNWPVGGNTPCIGCANEKFPDGMEPFVRY